MSSDRKDALIGEIVRFIVRADATALARLYALAKQEEKAMELHTDRSIGELLARRDGRKPNESADEEREPANGAAEQMKERQSPIASEQRVDSRE